MRGKEAGAIGMKEGRKEGPFYDYPLYEIRGQNRTGQARTRPDFFFSQFCQTENDQ